MVDSFSIYKQQQAAKNASKQWQRLLTDKSADLQLATSGPIVSGLPWASWEPPGRGGRA